MSATLKGFLVSLLLFGNFYTNASHLIGGFITYKYLSNNNYEVTLVVYQDCHSGHPEAIADDNPAFISIFDDTTSTANRILVDSIFSTSTSILTPDFIGCSQPPAMFCQQKITFSKTYTLPENFKPYRVVYQRCCRNHEITNIQDPHMYGATFFCDIPGTPFINRTAVFQDNPPPVICINNQFIINNVANDVDGDSLSYEFYQAMQGGEPAFPKPIPNPPPYSSVTYLPAYISNPMGASTGLNLDPTTGIMTGTANTPGNFLISIACHEWRSGVKINTARKEYELMVYCPNTLLPYVLDTTINAGETIGFDAPPGGAYYAWHPGSYLSDSTIRNPNGTFPVPGKFLYEIHVTDFNGCSREDTISVSVIKETQEEKHLVFLPNAFTPNGDHVNDVFAPITTGNIILKSFWIHNRSGQSVCNNISGWDGTTHGVPQSNGIYMWRLEYIDENGKHRSINGSVALIR